LKRATGAGNPQGAGSHEMAKEKSAGPYSNRDPPRGPPEKEATTFQNAASGILKRAGTEPHARSTVRPRKGSDRISKCRERHFETRDRHGEPPGGREQRNGQRKVRGATQQPRPTQGTPRKGSDHFSKCRERHFETRRDGAPRPKHGAPPKRKRPLFKMPRAAF